jgi:hypothetical protein
VNRQQICAKRPDTTFPDFQESAAHCCGAFFKKNGSDDDPVFNQFHHRQIVRGVAVGPAFFEGAVGLEIGGDFLGFYMADAIAGDEIAGEDPLFFFHLCADEIVIGKISEKIADIEVQTSRNDNDVMAFLVMVFKGANSARDPDWPCLQLLGNLCHSFRFLSAQRMKKKMLFEKGALIFALGQFSERPDSKAGGKKKARPTGSQDQKRKEGISFDECAVKIEKSDCTVLALI